jgi:hypothetical protein
VDILAALFVEGIDQRTVAGPATRIDLLGVMFSLAAPSAPPVVVTPHLVVIVHEPAGGTGSAALISEFVRQGSGDQIARNVQMVTIEPGKFGRQLVRPELEFTEYGAIEAQCRLNENGAIVRVPLTLLPPASG